jgi:MATE family multidrug resistance protein
VLLRYVAFFAFFDAMVVVFSSAVRGAGDTRFPMLVMLGTSWGIMLAPVATAEWLGVNTLHFSWGMCTFAIVISGLVMCLRFLGGRWKTMKVIENESPAKQVPAPHVPKSRIRDLVSPQPALDAV